MNSAKFVVVSAKISAADIHFCDENTSPKLIPKPLNNATVLDLALFCVTISFTYFL